AHPLYHGDKPSHQSDHGRRGRRVKKSRPRAMLSSASKCPNSSLLRSERRRGCPKGGRGGALAYRPDARPKLEVLTTHFSVTRPSPPICVNNRGQAPQAAHPLRPLPLQRSATAISKRQKRTGNPVARTVFPRRRGTHLRGRSRTVLKSSRLGRRRSSSIFIRDAVGRPG
ncbi:MAG: hypothetical protein QOF48_601, partial [Verrucomicrobiota bacterium]